MELNDAERGYLMAKSVHPWGFSYENEEHFAERISKYAEQHGIEAAARLISDECNSSGLQMSPKRVMKSMIWMEGQVRQHMPRPASSAPPRTPTKLDYTPPRDYVAKMNAEQAAWRESEARKSNRQMWLFWIIVAAVIGAIWYFVF